MQTQQSSMTKALRWVDVMWTLLAYFPVLVLMIVAWFIMSPIHDNRAITQAIYDMMDLSIDDLDKYIKTGEIY